MQIGNTAVSSIRSSHFLRTEGPAALTSWLLWHGIGSSSPHASWSMISLMRVRPPWYCSTKPESTTRRSPGFGRMPRKSYAAKNARRRKWQSLLLPPEETLTLRQMTDLAIWLSNKSEAKDKAKAAHLWFVLCERQPESDVYHGTKFYNFARGSICLAKSGQYAKAEPLLRQAVNWPDGVAATNYHNFLCRAFEQMLLHAREQGNLREFRRVWNEAVDRLQGLGRRFPTVYPIQTDMLAVALDMGMEDIIAYLVRLDPRNPRCGDTRQPHSHVAQTQRASKSRLMFH